MLVEDVPEACVLCIWKEPHKLRKTGGVFGRQVGPEAGASSDHPLLVVCHVSYLYALDSIEAALLAARPHARIAKMGKEGRFFEPKSRVSEKEGESDGGDESRVENPRVCACILGQYIDIGSADASATTVVYLGTDLAQRSQLRSALASTRCSTLTASAS